MSAAIGLGIAKAGANIQQYNREQPEREARRAEAKARQAKAEEFVGNKELRKSKSDLALEQAQADLRIIQTDNLRKTTFSAFDNYEASGEVRHLKNFLTDAKSNPQGARMYGNMVTVDALTRTPEVEAQLAQQGVTDIDGLFDSPEDLNNFVLATGPDGTQTVMKLDSIYQGSGYTKYASKEALAAMKTRQIREQLSKFGIAYKDMDNMTRAAAMIKEEMKIPLHEAIRLLTDAKASGRAKGGSTVERTAMEIMEAEGIPYLEAIDKAVLKLSSGNAQSRESKQQQMNNPGLSHEDAMSKAKGITQSNTSKQKNIESAKIVTERLDAKAGNGKSFYDMDMSDPANRRAVTNDIAELETLLGVEFSQSDKIAARKHMKVLDLAGKAGELTEEETGLFDNMLHGVKQYITDNVDGVEATTAYETIRNAVRHDLFGATLPDGEIRAFNRSLGGLGKQLGPILQQLKGTMETIKGELEAIASTNNEAISHYYLGASTEKISDAIHGIDQRIASLQVDKVGELKKVKNSPEHLKGILFGERK